jgi:hypothetical protein
MSLPAPEPAPGQALYAAPHVERHSRLTTFFRYLLAIPHFIWVSIYGFVAYLAGIVAWFAIVATGRYPEGLYRFVAGFLVYQSRVNAYIFLLSDVYPPFSGGGDTTYPVELLLGPPKASYSRLSALIRILPLIVVWVIVYALSIVVSLFAFFGWVVIVVVGRLPKGLHDVIAFCTSYNARAFAYAFLVTESFPGFDSSGASTPGGAPDSYATTA